jgi:hypothetical protein
VCRPHFKYLLQALVFSICCNVAVQLHAADSVAVENTKPGTALWQLSNPASMWGVNSTNASDYANAEIQGYASRPSINQGQSINFYARTINTNSYTLSIFRMGWYNGLGGRLMLGPVTLPGVVQRMPPTPVFQPAGTGLVECNWNASYSLTIPTDWVSGVYLVKLSLSQPAAESYIIFVVRDDTRNSPILVQTSFATYQAYNEWGGSSLYTWINGNKSGYKVSFNRPFWRNFGAGDFISLNGSPGYEIQLVRWLESQGYDVTYATDLDTHENPTLLLSHNVFLVTAHDEYWSWNMRVNVERGRDIGVHLGFLGGNASYWQVRFEPSSAGDPDRTMVGYKELAANDHPSDARYVTTTWRNIWPEAEMMGVQYNGVSDTTAGDIVITNPTHWLFNGTGVGNGSILPNVLGYETDSTAIYSPNGTIDLAHSPFPKGAPQVYADMSIYTALSGANVFATGSTWWSLGLDSFPPSQGIVPAVQQVTANFLNYALLKPPPPPPYNERLAAAVSTNEEAVGYPASNASDGNVTTQWVASLNSNDPNNNNAWIQLDFGAPMFVCCLKWLGAAGSPYPADSPTDYSIQSSNDGANWQAVITRSNATPVRTGAEPINQQTRYLRLATTKVGDGTGWSLSFLEFWAEGRAFLSSLALNPTSVTGGSPSIGTVTLSGPAPSDGAVVALSSSSTAGTIPSNVTVPAGATSASFNVSTGAVATATPVAISASYGGGTQTASLTVLPAILLSLTLNPATVTGGNPSTGTVTLNGPAPGGGAVVSLSSSDPSVATVPPSGSVTVPAGATSATFTVNTKIVLFSTSVTISASYNSATQSAILKVNSLVPVL